MVGLLPSRIAGSEPFAVNPNLRAEGKPRESRRIAVAAVTSGGEQAVIDAEEVHRGHGDPDDGFGDGQQCDADQHQGEGNRTRMPCGHGLDGVTFTHRLISGDGILSCCRFSWAALATRLGIPRQKVNYHLRTLEGHKLIRLAGKRKWAGSPSGCPSMPTM